MDVLLVLGEQRRAASLPEGCDILETLEVEFGNLVPNLKLALEDGVPGYTLQRHSSKWQTFIDVTDPTQVCDGDQLTVLEKQAPKVRVIQTLPIA